MKGKLILEDGSVFHGELLNNIKATGEVVFNTGMVGYQESLTDPSYCRQILTLTYPMVGNYGIADIFMQSRKSFVNGFVIGELCEHGSNWHYETSLADFLTKQGVPCLYNVDTRAVTRKIRNAGTTVILKPRSCIDLMMFCLTPKSIATTNGASSFSLSSV